MTSAISVAVVAQAADAEAEVLEAFDARRELQRAIEEQTAKRQAAEFELAKTFAKEIQTTPNLNIAEAAFQRNEAWGAADERAQQRIGALQSILDKVDKHFEQLKTAQPAAAKSALSKRQGVLKKAVEDEEASEKDLQYQIDRLQAEISKLPKADAAKKR